MWDAFVKLAFSACFWFGTLYQCTYDSLKMAYMMGPNLRSTHRRLRTEKAHRHITSGRPPMRKDAAGQVTPRASGAHLAERRWQRLHLRRWQSVVVRIKGRTQQLEHSRSNLPVQQAACESAKRQTVASRGGAKCAATGWPPALWCPTPTTWLHSYFR